MRRLIVAIPEAEADRLDDLARAQFRETRAQAALLLVDAIRRVPVVRNTRKPIREEAQ